MKNRGDTRKSKERSKSRGSTGGGDGKSSIASIDNNDAEQFKAFVQNEVNHHGFELTEEEEKMVQEAITMTLIENKDCGVDLDDFFGASDVEYGEEIDEVFE